MMFSQRRHDGAEKLGQRELRAPVEALEAGVLELAEHHEGEKDHERGQPDAAIAGGEFGLVLIIGDDEERDGGDEAGGGGNGEAGEVARAGAEIVGRRDVEAREPERAAEQIEAGDEPADLVRDIVEHDLEDEQRGRDAEADDVGQGIEFAAEGLSLPPRRARRPSRRSKTQAARMQ